MKIEINNKNIQHNISKQSFGRTSGNIILFSDQQSDAKTYAIPMTDENVKILGQLNVGDKVSGKLQFFNTTSRNRTVVLQEINHKDCTYTVEFVDEETDIYSELENLKLCDIFDSSQLVRLSERNVINSLNYDIWNKTDGWHDNSSMIVFAPFNSENNIKLEWEGQHIDSFRPFVNFVGLLHHALCKLGWKLDGSVYNSVYFRKLYLWLNKQDIRLGVDSNPNNYAELTGLNKTAFFDNPSRTIFNTTNDNIGYTDYTGVMVSAGGGHVLDYEGFQIKQHGTHRFIVTVTITNNDPTLEVPFFVEISNYIGLNTQPTLIYRSSPVFAPVNSTNTYTFEFEYYYDFLASALLNISMFGTALTSNYYDIQATFKVEKISTRLSEGDYFTACESFRDLTMGEVLKAVDEIFDLRATLDFGRRVLSLYPENDRTYNGEFIEGYRTANTDYYNVRAINNTSRKYVPKNRDLKRFVTYKYQDADDFTRALRPNENIHGYRQDRGVLFSGSEEKENSLFVPFLNSKNYDINPNDNDGLLLPYIKSSDDEHFVFDVGIGIFYAYGEQEWEMQNIDGGIGTWISGNYGFFPTSYLMSQANAQNLGYTNTTDKTYLELEDVVNSRTDTNNIKYYIEFEAIHDAREFDNIFTFDFRKKIKSLIEGNTERIIPIQISDFQEGCNPIKFKVVGMVLNNC